MKSREEIIKEIRESSNGSWDDMITEGFEAGIKYAQQSQPSPAGAAEGASEGMAEALRFAKWLADNDYRPGSGNKHWFKWNGMEVDENPLTIEQCYQIFASLSPGVEDGSGAVDSVYKPEYIEWRNKYFEYQPRLLEYKSKNRFLYFTRNDLHNLYEKAMAESPMK